MFFAFADNKPGRGQGVNHFLVHGQRLSTDHVGDELCTQGGTGNPAAAVGHIEIKSLCRAMGVVRGHGQGAAEGKKVDALATERHASVDDIDAVAPQLLPEAGEVVLQLGQVILVVTVGGMVMIFMEFESGWLPLKHIRGQVSYCRATDASRRWQQAQCHGGYLLR